MKKAVRIVFIILVLAAAAAGGYYYMNLPLNVAATQMAPVTAELYFVERGIADITGRVVVIYAPTSGKITELAVTEDQEVEAGDVLCRVDTSELLYQIAQAEISIKGYRAQIENLDLEEQRARDGMETSRNNLLSELRVIDAQSSGSGVTAGDQRRQKDEQLRLQRIVIEQNEKDLERAINDMEKAGMLYAAGALTRNEYELAENKVEVQEDLLERNLQQLQIIENTEVQYVNSGYYSAAKEAVRTQIEGIDSAIDNSYTAAMKKYYNTMIDGANATIEQLKKRIDDSVVTFPLSGALTTLHIKDANTLFAATPIAEVTTDLATRVEVYVSTNDINEIREGQRVDLILKRRGGDIEFEGTVTGIEDEAELRLSSLGVEERRVKVYVEPDADPAAGSETGSGADPAAGRDAGVYDIKKGYDVDVRFVSFREENRLIAPKTAFFTADGRDMVWTARDGKAAMAEVVKGRELRTSFIVESGLAAGDYVITDASDAGLREGVNIAIK